MSPLEADLTVESEARRMCPLEADLTGKPEVRRMTERLIDDGEVGATAVAATLVGIVVSQQANFYYVKCADEEFACSLRGRLKKEGETPYVGDRVGIVLETIAPGEKLLPPRGGSLALPTPRRDVEPGLRRGAIVQLFPRTRLLDRPTIANVDQILLVIAAARPEFSAYLLDKFLVLAASSDLPAVIVINKRDLVPPEVLAGWIDAYRALGYAVVATQATASGVEALVPHLAGKVSVLAGPSGVGKSSILNAIQPGLGLREAEVSTKLHRGRHTTRHASLYPIARVPDALVADTPGFSFLEIGDIAPAALGWYFPEMAALIPDCKYPSCLHLQEPQCAVKERGRITDARYDSYLRMLDEMQTLAREAADRTSKDEVLVKRRTARNGQEARLVKVDAADREATRGTRNHKLNASWQEDEIQETDD